MFICMYYHMYICVFVYVRVPQKKETRYFIGLIICILLLGGQTRYSIRRILPMYPKHLWCDPVYPYDMAGG